MYSGYKSFVKYVIYKCFKYFLSVACLFIFLFFKGFIYLFLEREEGREKQRERNINVCLPLAQPLPRTWPTTQTCALTGNQTGDPLVSRSVLNPLHQPGLSFHF